MEAILFVCSESATIDVRTNTLSVFHIMEEVNAANFPFLLQKFSVVVVLSRTEDEPQNPDFRVRIRLGDQELFDGPVAIGFQHHLRARAIADFFGLVIVAPGDLGVEARDATQTLGRWTTRINRVGQPGVNVFQPFFPAPPSEPVHRD